ncbi:hypothetical protein GGI25_003289 [Coemansia spiralis]|uniref:Arsenite methyltransferase n=2 Tax=Coemansia TaxID=4863 RepID=A0A9W8G7A2_9FUNG|nr:hypothetical protein BX070DRAFT_222192 [Coemansia spiralis]KAJ1992823.1 hypothetical protein EDC05_002607 [Coemansia umbellata]KAJ2622520.1 hypothetical protein GGI26_003119 [Coemansia sp. RSA 1358]KAJ2677069.1 hypothetical protein GGI25_003289 [Coemansia spiralis]
MAPKHFAPVWQHYERHEPTGRSKHHRAICKFCQYELSGQPERMKTHLQRCTACPAHIKDEFAEETAVSTPYGKDNFAISTALMEFEEDAVPMKRRRSVEIGGGAEGLAGLPWAPTANASAIAPAQTAVPPAFHPPYASASALPQPAPTIAQPANAPQGLTAAAASAAKAAKAPEPPFLGVYENVRGYYSRYTPMNKMQTSIGPTISPHPLIRDAIARVPKPIRDRFYGCGTPLPPGIEGLRVLDLGCGAGRDCYVAAKLVGPSGEVIGVDMTDEQLRVAREFVPEYSRALGYQPHLRFVKGYIEFLSQLPELYSGSIDLCISNNAVNLSPNKELVLRSVFDILKEGGEFQFSDIYADRRLPNHVRSHPVLMGECLGGALYTEDFKRLCQRVGFMDARQVSPPAAVRIESPELRDLVGATQFYSITFRLFKFARPSSVLEPTREDYGQVAVYRGTIEGQRARTRFDNQWAFEANRPVLVDGNTAVMLGESWLRRHFEVRGDRSLHFGGFANEPAPVQHEPWETDVDEDADEPRRRPGILPLPTPYFINGLQQQKLREQTGGSQGASRQSSPEPQSPARILPAIVMGNVHRAAVRDHPTFPRLSSFSISQSNVRADSAMRPPGAKPPDSAKYATSPRFVVPAGRVSKPMSPPTESPMRSAESPKGYSALSASSSSTSLAGARFEHQMSFSAGSSVRSPVAGPILASRQQSPASVVASLN